MKRQGFRFSTHVFVTSDKAGLASELTIDHDGVIDEGEVECFDWTSLLTPNLREQADDWRLMTDAEVDHYLNSKSINPPKRRKYRKSV